MQKLVRLTPVIVVAFAAVWIFACGKSKNSANPYAPAPAAAGELSGSLGTTGAQYPHTFSTAGTFSYFCTVHPTCTSLQGRVVVVAPTVPIQNRVLAISIDGGSSGPYGSTCAALSLPADSVHVGDQVVWTNNSPLPHTVTSR